MAFTVETDTHGDSYGNPPVKDAAHEAVTNPEWGFKAQADTRLDLRKVMAWWRAPSEECFGIGTSYSTEHNVQSSQSLFLA